MLTKVLYVSISVYNVYRERGRERERERKKERDTGIVKNHNRFE